MKKLRTCWTLATWREISALPGLGAGKVSAVSQRSRKAFRKQVKNQEGGSPRRLRPSATFTFRLWASDGTYPPEQSAQTCSKDDFPGGGKGVCALPCYFFLVGGYMLTEKNHRVWGDSLPASARLQEVAQGLGPAS